MNRATQTLGITPQELVTKMKECEFKFTRYSYGTSKCGCLVTALLVNNKEVDINNDTLDIFSFSFENLKEKLNLTVSQVLEIVNGFDNYNRINETSDFCLYGKEVASIAKEEGILV